MSLTELKMKKSQYLLLLFFASLLCFDNLFSQQTWDNLPFENINIVNGLSHNTVQKIFQDSDGYMWFATKDGLCRYDGNNYVTYRESWRHKSLSNSKVRCISEDNNKNIWAGTDNGLNMIDPITQRVVPFLLNAHPQMKSNKINDLYFDFNSNNLWIATESGVALYNTAQETFIELGKEAPFEEAVNTIGSLSKDEIYIGTHSALYIYDKLEEKSRRISLSGSNSSYNVFSVFQDSSENIWVGNSMNLLGKIGKGEQTISMLNVDNIKMSEDYNIGSIIEVNDVLWLVSKRKGIFFYDLKQGELIGRKEHFSLNALGKNGEEKIMLTSAYKDNNGTVWVGSYYMGIFYYSPYINQINHIYIMRSQQSSTGVVGPIIQDENGLWLGSSGIGITYYDLNSRKQQYYEIYDSGVSLTECKPLLINKNVLWIGTDSHGIYLFDLKTRRIIKQYNASSKQAWIPGNRINYGLKDSNGYIWIGYNGTPGGICRYDATTDTFITLHPSNTDKKVVRDVYYIHQVSADELWLGTRSNGLFRYTISKNAFDPISIMDREDLSVSYIFEDSRKQVWVGTFGQGLMCMNYDGSIKKLFDNNTSNINNNICGILEDDNNRIWISSFNEIAYYDDKNDKFVKYDINNNFPIQHVKSMSCLYSGERLLYFGGSNGVVEINPKDLMHLNEIPPKVVLTDFYIHNQPVDTIIRRTVLRNRTVKLKYNQQNLTFFFAALNYIYPDKNQYRYKLEGIDSDWNTTNTQRLVTYNNLTAGKYHFLVSACNNSEIWSNPEKLAVIVIEPAPWFTWWAYMIYGIMIVGLLAVFFYYQKVKMKLEHDLDLQNVEKKNLEKMHKFRLDLFTNFSHEIRTPLTLISVSLDDIMQNSSNASAFNKSVLAGIEKNINKITRLVNQLMDFRKHDEGRMELEPSEQDLIPFIQEIISAFGELSYVKNHPIKVNISEERLTLWFNPQLIEQVLHNILMNAFKYSYDESVIELNVEVINLRESVYANKVDKQIKLAVLVSIFNEGDNIPDDKLEKLFEPFYRLKHTGNIQGTGIGLSLNRMIMRLHHGDVWVENIPGEGIVFKFLIPMGKEHLEAELNKDLVNEYQSSVSIPLTHHPVAPIEQHVVKKELRTLLLVEDNEEIMSYLQGKLLFFYNILCCANGREALNIVNKKEIDLVISDVMMPVMDGIELCKAIKGNLETNHIPVILLTARTSDMHIKEGFYSGANEYVPKPFKIDLLLARIQNLLDNNERLRQSFQKRITPREVNAEVPDYDEQFLQKCYAFLRSNLTNPDLTIEDFGKEIGLSRVHLYRKLKYLTNLSPSQFILSQRLKVAADLLRQEGVSVSDVCYQVGFNNLSYFIRCFKQAYKQSPSDYKCRK